MGQPSVPGVYSVIDFSAIQMAKTPAIFRNAVRALWSWARFSIGWCLRKDKIHYKFPKHQPESGPLDNHEALAACEVEDDLPARPEGQQSDVTRV